MMTSPRGVFRGGAHGTPPNSANRPNANCLEYTRHS